MQLCPNFHKLNFPQIVRNIPKKKQRERKKFLLNAERDSSLKQCNITILYEPLFLECLPFSTVFLPTIVLNVLFCFIVQMNISFVSLVFFKTPKIHRNRTLLQLKSKRKKVESQRLPTSWFLALFPSIVPTDYGKHILKTTPLILK